MSEQTGSAIDAILPMSEVIALAQDLKINILSALTNPEFLLQIVLLIVAIVPAILFGSRFSRLVMELEKRTDVQLLKRTAHAAGVLSIPIIAYLSLTAFRIGLGSFGLASAWISGAIALLSAWIVVRAVTLVIQSEFWSRAAFFIAWPIAVLDVFGLLGPVVEQMQTLALPLGEGQDGKAIEISMLDIVRTLIYFVVLFWGANLVSRILQQQIDQINDISPSFKALLGKILNVLLPIIALVIAFQIVGFNIATLAVFSGAVGLGIGLGLQRIVGNFLAGFALVADRSIKPNDIIEIDGNLGRVTSMQARYIALRTRDGTELLIPNERLLTEGVVNWSRSDRVIRLYAPFGVSYSTGDLEQVQRLAVEATGDVDRVVSLPEPTCNLVEFGDSSVNFNVRFWIGDPEEGTENVTSDVLMAIWKALKAKGIEIPFPQRDLHIKTWNATEVSSNE